jgi:competence protein ComEA
VDRRTKHGPFHTVDDLRDVKGIGKKRMDQLRPLVTIDPTGNATPTRETVQRAKDL